MGSTVTRSAKFAAARELAQVHLANVLHVKQASIAKLERRADMYVGTLRDFVRAMGGELEIQPPAAATQRSSHFPWFSRTAQNE